MIACADEQDQTPALGNLWVNSPHWCLITSAWCYVSLYILSCGSISKYMTIQSSIVTCFFITFCSYSPQLKFNWLCAVCIGPLSSSVLQHHIYSPRWNSYEVVLQSCFALCSWILLFSLRILVSYSRSHPSDPGVQWLSANHWSSSLSLTRVFKIDRFVRLFSPRSLASSCFWLFPRWPVKPLSYNKLLWNYCIKQQWLQVSLWVQIKRQLENS